MMFDDSKRLDKLESQMGEVQKAVKDMATAIADLSKAMNDKFKQLDFANEDKDRQFLGIRKSRLEPLETDVKALNDAMKKLQPRVTNLEVQVKKLGK